MAGGVPRFIRPDYAADFTRTQPGDNRNFNLRREFVARIDTAPIRATSVLRGAFMDMLDAVRYVRCNSDSLWSRCARY